MQKSKEIFLFSNVKSVILRNISIKSSTFSNIFLFKQVENLLIENCTFSNNNLPKNRIL